MKRGEGEGGRLLLGSLGRIQSRNQRVVRDSREESGTKTRWAWDQVEMLKRCVVLVELREHEVSDTRELEARWLKTKR